LPILTPGAKRAITSMNLATIVNVKQTTQNTHKNTVHNTHHYWSLLMKSRKAVTITLSQAAIDALAVLSALDHRSKSQQLEHLIFDAVEKKNVNVPGYAPTEKVEEAKPEQTKSFVSAENSYTTNGTIV
jgi:hypothetical protein